MAHDPLSLYGGPLVPLLELMYEGVEHLTEVARKSIGNCGAMPGRTLRPGNQTPLWNQLRGVLRPYLRRRGSQAELARLLGLPRQRVNAYLTSGKQMPDAERTLQLVAWLMETRAGRRPRP